MVRLLKVADQRQGTRVFRALLDPMALKAFEL